MANNTVLNPGALGDTIATLDVAGVKHEKTIEEFLDGGGNPIMVSAANPLPVTDAVSEAALTSIAAEDFATQATLAAMLAKLSSDPATQTTLAAILAKIIAAPSTEAKQDIIITALNSIDAGTAAALGQALMAASVPVVIASNQSAIPISGTVTVDTSLLATAAKQDTGNTSLAAILAKIISAPSTEAKQDTGNTSLASIKTNTDNLATPTTVLHGQTTVTTAGTRVALASSTACKSVTVKAFSTNIGIIYVGSSTVSSSNGFRLWAGDSISLDIANLSTINIDSSISGESVSYLGVQ